MSLDNGPYGCAVMSMISLQPAKRVEAARAATAALNLHVPPSYFPTRTVHGRYEVAVQPLKGSDDPGPLHLYVGVPLCEERCRFCMYFNGLVDGSKARTESCTAGLVTFLDLLGSIAGRPVAAIYVGGGTPTVLEASQISRLCVALGSAFDFEPQAQRTFEMSPGTATPAKIDAIAAGGFNRVSFGVQTFERAALEMSGRSYSTPADVAALLTQLPRAGFVEVNVDLLVGIKGAQPGALADDTGVLLAAGCPTISVYRYRPARASEIAVRGGMDEYVRWCVGEVEAAAAVAEQHGFVALGPTNGEHVHFAGSPESPFPERNHYETRHGVGLGNSLMGVGASARSMLRDERFISCHHRAADGFELVGRRVEIQECDPPERLAAAIVNEFFRSGSADLALIGATSGLDPRDVYAEELTYLNNLGALKLDGSVARINPTFRDEWVYLDKLLYPPQWLADRISGKRVRVR